MLWIKKNSSKIVSFIFLLLMSLIWLFPLVWTVFSSFKPEVEIMKIGYHFTPIEWTLQNFKDIFNDKGTAPIGKWFLNSILISGSHTILVLVIASLSAYAYARLNFKGRDFIFWFLMATMMFPAVINLIPTFKIVHLFKWINTPLAVIVPGLGGVFNIYLIRQFLLGIPKDFDEAARIDGANMFDVYLRIILPLTKPVLTVVALFAFTGSWNDFLWPSIVMNDIDKMPLTPGLKLLQGAYTSEMAHLSAGAMIAIIPPLVLYIFAQKYFLKGINMSSGVKG